MEKPNTIHTRRVGISTEPLDGRQGVYGRRVDVVVIFEGNIEDQLPRGWSPLPYPSIVGHLIERLPLSDKVAVRDRREVSCHKVGDAWHLLCTFDLEVDKGADIPDEDEALELLAGGPEQLMAAVVGTLVEINTEQHTVLRKIRQHTQVVEVARQAALAAHEQACRAVRFEARLRGLIAELEAEQEEQLRILFEEGGRYDQSVAQQNAAWAAGDESVKYRIDERVQAVARRFAEHFMPEADPRHASSQAPAPDREIYEALS